MQGSSCMSAVVAGRAAGWSCRCEVGAEHAAEAAGSSGRRARHGRQRPIIQRQLRFASKKAKLPPPPRLPAQIPQRHPHAYTTTPPPPLPMSLALLRQRRLVHPPDDPLSLSLSLSLSPSLLSFGLPWLLPRGPATISISTPSSTPPILTAPPLLTLSFPSLPPSLPPSLDFFTGNRQHRYVFWNISLVLHVLHIFISDPA